jgi:hypothetical protein
MNCCYCQKPVGKRNFSYADVQNAYNTRYFFHKECAEKEELLRNKEYKK